MSRAQGQLQTPFDRVPDVCMYSPLSHWQEQAQQMHVEGPCDAHMPHRGLGTLNPSRSWLAGCVAASLATGYLVACHTTTVLLSGPSPVASEDPSALRTATSHLSPRPMPHLLRQARPDVDRPDAVMCVEPFPKRPSGSFADHVGRIHSAADWAVGVSVAFLGLLGAVVAHFGPRSRCQPSQSPVSMMFCSAAVGV